MLREKERDVPIFGWHRHVVWISSTEIDLRLDDPTQVLKAFRQDSWMRSDVHLENARKARHAVVADRDIPRRVVHLALGVENEPRHVRVVLREELRPDSRSEEVRRFRARAPQQRPT